jgi:hypothetical protein
MGIYLVMRNNFLRMLRHKILLVVTFLLPVLLCFITGLIDFDKVSLRVGVLTMQEGNRLMDVLDKTEGITYAHVNQSTVHTDLMTGKYHVIINCRSDNPPEMMTYKPEQYKLHIQSALLAALEREGPLQLQGLKQTGLSVAERSVSLFLSLFMMFTVVYASFLIRDRQNGTALRYQFANRGTLGYLGGTMGYVFCLTFLQVLCGMAVLTFLQENFNVGIGKGICIAAVIALLSTVFSVIICNYSNSEVKANVTASSVCVVMSLLGGLFVPVQALPGALRFFSYGSPMRWLLELMKIL